MNQHFYVKQRKNQCKIWRLEKEKQLRDHLQENNTADGGKMDIVGYGTMITRLNNEKMNGTLYCDVLEQELKQSIEKIPNKN
jgi:hypothetical protein